MTNDDSRDVRVYRLEVLVIDHDEVGEDGIRSMIENARYPNRAISPKVKRFEERTVRWTDQHPLNMSETADAAYRRLFARDPYYEKEIRRLYNEIADLESRMDDLVTSRTREPNR